MKQLLALFVATVVVVFSVIGSVAQSAKGMTNADVIKMVTAGLSDELIIATIHQSETAKFDTSPEALIKLKASKVNDSVITVIMNRNTSSARVVLSPVALVPSMPSSAVGQLTIPDGVEVRLRLTERLTSATARVDQRVRFEVAEDVLVNDKVVIPMGAQASGAVIEAQKKKSFGRAGKLNFTIDYVKAVDGQNIRLRTTKERKGDESYVKAGVITYLAGPFGLLVKGKEVEIPAGIEYTIFIDGERRINLKPTAER
ncbi:MAG: hypothetical protein A2734_02815 [Parcubacteria group bacterium RIFCSPHIGHO2_01_FULL_40_30]|nr:MAG: hypothetical protein A2734_02815 [Parcubacteria group bacterium RIFCSPHIGHO2_01_FULL_40_30]OHB23581.1 MAG: hypothetical protein A3I22_02955 [Parcubacteria group bacterium RIFCSPLOWO2_02_FULL_40_12]